LAKGSHDFVYKLKHKLSEFRNRIANKMVVPMDEELNTPLRVLLSADKLVFAQERRERSPIPMADDDNEDPHDLGETSSAVSCIM
jgi:hypothetical protein